MTDDVKRLDDALTALDAKADETATTLRDLAQGVLDLRALILHPQVTALADRAEQILAKLSSAEDAADDVLPVTPAPEPEPEPEPPTE